MNAEAIQLRKIRDKLAALDGAEWRLCCDSDAKFVEALTPQGELNKIATFHPGATFDEIEFIVGAPFMVTFMLDLVDRAIVALRQGAPRQSAQGRAQNFAAEAAMKCEDAAFKVFLEQCHGLERPLTADRAAEKLRSILKIQSRKQLNDNAAAADRWRDLRRSFEAWRKVGR